MKTSIYKLLPLFLLLFIAFVSCEDEKDSIEDQLVEKLYVKFTNESESEYTISGIQILNMGVAGTQEEPTGDFGDNILTDGQTIAPGEHIFFYLDIPNLHYAYCRLTHIAGYFAKS